MPTFFSGTDVATLNKEGSCMPHFVSLIVNNAGKYSAKITRKVTVSSPKISYPTFGGEVRTEDCELTINEYIETFPLSIIIEEDTSIKDMVVSRIEELNKAKRASCSETTSKDIIFPKNPWYNSSYGWNGMSYDEYKKLSESPSNFEKDKKMRKKEEKKEQKVEQPTLFKKVPDDDDWVSIEVPEEIRKRLIIQLLTGSITSGYNEQLDIKAWYDKAMVKAFMRRFNNDKEVIESWFDFYIEFLLNFTIWEEVKDVDTEIIVKVLANALLEDLVDFDSNVIMDIIETKLKEFVK